MQKNLKNVEKFYKNQRKIVKIKINNYLKNLVSTLQEKQQQRLIPKFDDQENKKLNKSIKELGNDMTQELRECQKILKEIINDRTDEDDINDINILNSGSNKQIKQNMKQNIVTKLNDFTKKFKLNQELYNNKFKDLVIDEESANKSFSMKKNEENSNDFLSTQENSDQLMRRDEDLTNLLKSVNELAQIFKDMQTLVMEQGTILDRIDYNTYQARHNIRRGNREMEEAHERLKSGCLRRLNQILIFAIFIMSILIIFKFF